MKALTNEERPSHQKSLGSEVSSMSSDGRAMYGVYNGLLLMRGNIHSALEVQITIGHVPVIFGQTREQGGALLKGFKGLEYQRI